jgi:membrane-associated phospholipid phosphatase
MDKKTVFTILIAFFAILSLFIDNFVSLQIQNIQTPMLNNIMIGISFISKFISVLILTFLFASYIILMKKQKRYLVQMFFALLVSSAIVYFLKEIINRQRPWQVLNIQPLDNDTSPSFPSGHTNAVFSVMPSIWITFKRFRYVWLVFAVLAAFSRIYLGAHYLSDVIFSMILGLAIGYFFIWAENKYRISRLFGIKPKNSV